jgi:hypothetical protein
MHELKIQNILEKMGVMDSPDKIENYIKKTSPDSPLSGVMVWNSALEYTVDARLMLALMELDSRFGTLGIATRTFNPGNVGNNGVDERIYSSWEEGVSAVARWLNNHRITKATTEEIAPTPVEEVQEETSNQIQDEPMPEEILNENTNTESTTPTPEETTVSSIKKRGKNVA